MKNDRTKVRWVIALALLILVGNLGCNNSRQNSDQKKVSPISETPPKFEPLPREAPVIPPPKTIASVGDCAPKYANGLHGACVNNQPCRGIAVLDEVGKPACGCYAKAGGCSAKERCDAIKKACVPEEEPGFGRAAED